MEEINLYDLVRYYLRKWSVILSLVMLGLIAGLVYNDFIQTPQYKSESTLFLINSENGRGAQDLTSINNYVELFQSRRVLSPVMEQQDIDLTYQQVVGAIEASAEKDTDVMKVSFTTGDPKESQKFLEEAVSSFKDQAEELYGSDNVQIVDDANLADEPFNVRPGLQLALAATAGLMLALITLFFAYDIKLSRQSTPTVAEADGKKRGNKNKGRRTLIRRALAWLLTGKGDAPYSAPKSEPGKVKKAKNKPTTAGSTSQVVNKDDNIKGNKNNTTNKSSDQINFGIDYESTDDSDQSAPKS